VQDIGTFFSLKDELDAGAEISIDANSRAFLTKYGVDLTGVTDGEYIIQEDLDIVADNLGDIIRQQGSQGTPTIAEGVTDEDVANGNARLQIREDGLLEWGKVNVSL
jgi:hypothetical protein